MVLDLHVLLTERHQRVPYDEVNDAYLLTETNRAGCTGIFDFYSGIC
ncbi:MAG: hypothetical protein GY822_03645 [Deltaproteobacteria bacterium]|nr:hypothetical protein [Deltaproteobacteria bacterium]